jgi:hypothetical protein
MDEESSLILKAHNKSYISLLAFCSCFGIRAESRHGKINNIKGFIKKRSDFFEYLTIPYFLIDITKIIEIQNI